MSQPQTVFLIDDDPAARASVEALVRSHNLRARSYESAESFLADLDRSWSGCIVSDLRMPGMSGLDLQERLNEKHVHLPLIIITGYGNVPTAVQAMHQGAITFLEKSCGDRELWTAIESALAWERASRDRLQRRDELRRRLNSLTDEERRVLKLLVEGTANKSIARTLDIGLRTAELRRASVMKKMESDSLAELVALALEAGFPDEPSDKPFRNTSATNVNRPLPR